jgi:hypothetical protein
MDPPEADGPAAKNSLERLFNKKTPGTLFYSTGCFAGLGGS